MHEEKVDASVTNTSSNADVTIKKIDDTDLKKIKPQPYRFKYSDDMVKKLTEFSLENIDADKHEFSEAWRAFVNEESMEALIEKEGEHLETSGYTGTSESMLLKLYRSAKYYFVKKARRERRITEISKSTVVDQCRKSTTIGTNSEKEENENESCKKRKQEEETVEKKKRPYYKVSVSILERMDKYIHDEISTVVGGNHKESDNMDDDVDKSGKDKSNKSNKNVTLSHRTRLKPSFMYENFCEANILMLQEEEKRMIQEDYPMSNITTKFKKTFKNRCFTIFSNNKI